MYYLVEQDIDSHWETNMSMYASSPEELMNRLVPDGMYMREFDSYTMPTSMLYRIIHPRDEFLDKFVAVIYSGF